MKLICGIDPGKRGGIAILHKTINVYPYTDQKLLELMPVLKLNNGIVVLEKQWARPSQGATATFLLGEEYGYIKGVIEANDVPYILVAPQTWKKEFGVTADKQSSIDMAKKLFPGINLLPTARSRKDSDGMAEAAVLSVWGRRNYDRYRKD